MNENLSTVIEQMKLAAYEAYKAEWLGANLSPREQVDRFANYIAEAKTGFEEHDSKPMSLEDYEMHSCGNGSLYAGYYEFLDVEYRDVEYMMNLIGDDNYRFLLLNDPELKSLKDKIYPADLKIKPEVKEER